MKILYHHRIGSKDGQVVHLEELIAALRALGHEVLVVGPATFARAPFGHDPKGIGFLKRHMPRPLYEILEIGYNLVAYFRLHRACRQFRPDFIYERYNLYLLAGIWYKKLYRMPLVLEVNAPLARERASFGGLGLHALARLLERRVWMNANHLFPVTRVLAGEIQEQRVCAKRITVIPNAIDPERFAFDVDGTTAKAELQLSGKLVLGFIGFVREWNGLDSVISLLAQPDTPANLHLLVVGEGPVITDLKIQAQEFGVIARVTFAGLVERDRIARYLTAFDIALVPKCVEYCSPIKLFEYMAAGKAIVAPDQPNIREVLENNESGLLFPPDALEAMSEAILRLSRDDGLRDRLGDAARQLISSGGYTWQHNAARVSAIGAMAAQSCGRG